MLGMLYHFKRVRRLIENQRAHQWHGYTRSNDGTIRYFDPPGSTGTSVTGCDAKDNVAGYYLDSSGISHGFLRSR